MSSREANAMIYRRPDRERNRFGGAPPREGL